MTPPIIKNAKDRTRVAKFLAAQIDALRADNADKAAAKLNCDRHFAAICALRHMYRVTIGGVPQITQEARP